MYSNQAVKSIWHGQKVAKVPGKAVYCREKTERAALRVEQHKDFQLWKLVFRKTLFKTKFSFYEKAIIPNIADFMLQRLFYFLQEKTVYM
jgi:hypothetical protein